VVKRNVLNVEFHISNYTKIINQLREEIVSLRNQLSQGIPKQSLNNNSKMMPSQP
jgi:kinesin family member 18/19